MARIVERYAAGALARLARIVAGSRATFLLGELEGLLLPTQPSVDPRLPSLDSRSGQLRAPDLQRLQLDAFAACCACGRKRPRPVACPDRHCGACAVVATYRLSDFSSSPIACKARWSCCRRHLPCPPGGGGGTGKNLMPLT